MSTTKQNAVCHCGNPGCKVPGIAHAIDDYLTDGGNVEEMRLMWCTAPSCRAFEVVDAETYRATRLTARCPDHQVTP